MPATHPRVGLHVFAAWSLTGTNTADWRAGWLDGCPANRHGPQALWRLVDHHGRTRRRRDPGRWPSRALSQRGKCELAIIPANGASAPKPVSRTTATA